MVDVVRLLLTTEFFASNSKDYWLCLSVETMLYSRSFISAHRKSAFEACQFGQMCGIQAVWMQTWDFDAVDADNDKDNVVKDLGIVVCSCLMRSVCVYFSS